jgi:OmpA-OmpF porin, OOP family
MAKKIIYPVGILLTIIIGSLLFRSYCCNKIEDARVIIPPTEPAKEVVQASVAPAEPAKPDYNALKEKINVDPLTFYFNTNQSDITLTDLEKTKIADIITYLENVTDGSVVVTGYTDNSGSREKNIQLGQGRAEFIKSFLVKNGMAENKIAAASKGPDEPVAGNDTPEGKAKNRRTIVLIK